MTTLNLSKTNKKLPSKVPKAYKCSFEGCQARKSESAYTHHKLYNVKRHIWNTHLRHKRDPPNNEKFEILNKKGKLSQLMNQSIEFYIAKVENKTPRFTLDLKLKRSSTADGDGKTKSPRNYRDGKSSSPRGGHAREVYGASSAFRRRGRTASPRSPSTRSPRTYAPTSSMPLTVTDTSPTFPSSSLPLGVAANATAYPSIFDRRGSVELDFHMGKLQLEEGGTLVGSDEYSALSSPYDTPSESPVGTPRTLTANQSPRDPFDLPRQEASLLPSPLGTESMMELGFGDVALQNIHEEVAERLGPEFFSSPLISSEPMGMDELALGDQTLAALEHRPVESTS